MRPQTRAERAQSAPVDAEGQGPGAGALPRSVLVGLIGAGIQASRSPALHEREAAAQGLRGIYRLIDLQVLGLSADAVGELVTAAERMGFAGVNVTHPCKQAVLPELTRLSPDALAIGAVNTVVFESGGRVGYNTDAYGFGESLKRGLPGAKLERIVQIGAGGAGAAVAHAALTLGAGEVAIIDLDATRAESLVDRLCRGFGRGRARATQDAGDALSGADGVVNATPIGMAWYPGTPVPDTLLRPDLWVADIVYTPLETELLRAARRLGCRTLAGGGMAVFQAVEAFRLFTGIAPDAARMLRHFETMCAAGANSTVEQPHPKGG